MNIARRLVAASSAVAIALLGVFGSAAEAAPRVNEERYLAEFHVDGRLIQCSVIGQSSYELRRVVDDEGVVTWWSALEASTRVVDDDVECTRLVFVQTLLDWQLPDFKRGEASTVEYNGLDASVQVSLEQAVRGMVGIHYVWFLCDEFVGGCGYIFETNPK